jgi:hypothetical protein
MENDVRALVAATINGTSRIVQIRRSGTVLRRKAHQSPKPR